MTITTTNEVAGIRPVSLDSEGLDFWLATGTGRIESTHLNARVQTTADSTPSGAIGFNRNPTLVFTLSADSASAVLTAGNVGNW